MASLVDLHLHSTASDGAQTVEDLIGLAVQVGLKTIALTDHDTTAALDQALEIGQRLGLEVIPGVELSSEEDGEVHILGYFIQYKNVAFQKALERFRFLRYGRTQLILEKLAALGMPLEFERVLQIAGDAAPQRPHIAEALKEKGYIQNVSDAFQLYIGNDGPAYVRTEKVTPVEAVELVQSVGGLAVLAHPNYVKNLEQVLPKIVEAGLTGLEVYYGHNSDEEVAYYKALAVQHNLVPTGGSDWHGRDDGGQVYIGERIVPPEVIVQLKARLK
ncbi:MAG: PHP domain-containing protein [Chloroflexota bacterium]